MLNVASPRWPSSASSPTIRLESSPPESSTPTGMSATSRRRTAIRSASSTASSQPVAGQHHPAGVPLVDDHDEHAVQVVDEVGAPEVVALEQHLGVAGGEEPV